MSQGITCIVYNTYYKSCHADVTVCVCAWVVKFAVFGFNVYFFFYHPVQTNENFQTVQQQVCATVELEKERNDENLVQVHIIYTAGEGAVLG